MHRLWHIVDKRKKKFARFPLRIGETSLKCLFSTAGLHDGGRWPLLPPADGGALQLPAEAGHSLHDHRAGERTLFCADFS